MTYLVKFGASWCQPCQKLDPQLAQMVEDHDVEIHDVDVDEISPTLLETWGVTGVPALFFMTPEGEVYDDARGAVPPHEILEMLMGGSEV